MIPAAEVGSRLYRPARPPSHVVVPCPHCGAPRLHLAERPGPDNLPRLTRGAIIGTVIGMALWAVLCFGFAWGWVWVEGAR